MLAHLGKEFMVGCKGVVLRHWCEREDFGVEIMCLLDGIAGKFEMVDTIEGRRHCGVLGLVGHAECLREVSVVREEL